MRINALPQTKGRAARLLILLACAALFASACSKTDNANSTNTSSSNTSGTTNTASANTSTSSTSGTAGSPLAAYKAFQEANKKKDYEAVKKSFSKASLEMLTDEAKKQNKTLDDFVKDQVDKAQPEEEVSNEKVNGDTATVEVKDKEGKSSITLPMVKEDGAWKIAYDKFMQQLKDEFEQMGKEMNKGNTNSDGDKHGTGDDHK